MKRRDLIDSDGKVIGQVEVGDKGTLTLTGLAAAQFRSMKQQLGAEKTGEVLIRDGWSNGYVRLGDVKEE